MSKVLINNVVLGTGALYAGTPIIDAAQQVAVVAAGGVLIDTAISASFAAAAALTQSFAVQGRGTPEIWQGMMQAALENVVGAGSSNIFEYSVTSSYKDFAGLAAGVKTFDYNIGPALPYNARLLSLPIADTWTGFDDATHAVDQAKVGITAGGVELGAAVAIDVTTGTGFPKLFAAGAYDGYALPAATQMRLRVSSTVDLHTLTAGALTVRCLVAYLG